MCIIYIFFFSAMHRRHKNFVIFLFIFLFIFVFIFRNAKRRFMFFIFICFDWKYSKQFSKFSENKIDVSKQNKKYDDALQTIAVFHDASLNSKIEKNIHVPERKIRTKKTFDAIFKIRQFSKFKNVSKNKQTKLSNQID